MCKIKCNNCRYSRIEICGYFEHLSWKRKCLYRKDDYDIVETVNDWDYCSHAKEKQVGEWFFLKDSETSDTYICPICKYVYFPDKYLKVPGECPNCGANLSSKNNDITEDDEFVSFTEKEAREYKDSLMKAYKPVKLNIFDEVDTANINEDEYIEAMDKAQKLVYEATKHYVPDPVPDISEMRDATPKEEKGITDYIHSIANPTGIKFDEVK